MTLHLEKLQRLCRICRKRTKSTHGGQNDEAVSETAIQGSTQHSSELKRASKAMNVGINTEQPPRPFIEESDRSLNYVI